MGFYVLLNNLKCCSKHGSYYSIWLLFSWTSYKLDHGSNGKAKTFLNNCAIWFITYVFCDIHEYNGNMF